MAFERLKNLWRLSEVAQMERDEKGNLTLEIKRPHPQGKARIVDMTPDMDFNEA
jgi:hypothetical protein